VSRVDRKDKHFYVVWIGRNIHHMSYDVADRSDIINDVKRMLDTNLEPKWYKCNPPT
jgi:hypothetical protein